MQEGERKEFASHDTTIIITVNTPIQSVVAVASLFLTRNGGGRGGNRLTLVLLTSASISPADWPLACPLVLSLSSNSEYSGGGGGASFLSLLSLYSPHSPSPFLSVPSVPSSVRPSATFLSGFTGELLLLLARPPARSLRCIALLTQFPLPPPPPAMALRPSVPPSAPSLCPSVRRPTAAFDSHSGAAAPPPQRAPLHSAAAIPPRPTPRCMTGRQTLKG